MNRTAIASLGLGLLVMVGAALISVRFQSRPAPTAASATPAFFAELRKFSAPGWSVQERPLGETELGRALVEKTLQFDEAMFLHFQSPQREFAVYAAFWKPGKVELRAVNAHTPDTCWVNSGWSTVRSRHGYTGENGRTLLVPGEYRCYTNQGALQHVAFWHLVGGRPVPMWRNGFPLFSYMWEIFVGDRGQLASEQVFIRISSPQDFETLWQDPVFRRVIALLQPLQEGGPDHAP